MSQLGSDCALPSNKSRCSPCLYLAGRAHALLLRALAIADQLEPIHRAAYYGDLASINQLLQQDAGLLEAHVQGEIHVDDEGTRVTGSTPLMLASFRGHDAVVARLLALGADVTIEADNDYDFQAVLAVTPPSLKPLVEKGRDVPELLGVSGDDEELVACVKYALRLEGGGGVVMEGQEPQVGMLPEVFVELCEMMVPTYARKRK